MTDNRRINIPSRRGGEMLSLFRDGGYISASIDNGDDEVGMVFSEADLARLRTWLNTGSSPSSIDLVDPVPPVVTARTRATLDPKPRDYRVVADRGPVECRIGDEVITREARVESKPPMADGVAATVAELHALRSAVHLLQEQARKMAGEKRVEVDASAETQRSEGCGAAWDEAPAEGCSDPSWHNEEM